MSAPASGKLRAAQAAAELVETGMTVGLGSGTTASLVIQQLGQRVRDEGLKILAVATSVATAELAQSLRIPLRDVDAVDALDVAIDGADEVDPEFRMIKGRGGALLREKIVASVARRRIIVVTPDKRVSRLGLHAPLPVEVSPVGTRHIEARLREIATSTNLRTRPDGSPYQTDGGNKIIDCRFPNIDDPLALDTVIQRVVGVYETGFFFGLCDVLLVGHDDQVERVERPTDNDHTPRG
jgi:ribose 5-phosphate isomerase A